MHASIGTAVRTLGHLFTSI